MKPGPSSPNPSTTPIAVEAVASQMLRTQWFGLWRAHFQDLRRARSSAVRNPVIDLEMGWS